MTGRPSFAGARFATTRWSLVVAAGEGITPEGRAALESLCRDCWFPLYAFARRGGARAEEAQDLVQGFFAELLEKGSLRQADPARGTVPDVPPRRVPPPRVEGARARSRVEAGRRRRAFLARRRSTASGATSPSPRTTARRSASTSVAGRSRCSTACSPTCAPPTATATAPPSSRRCAPSSWRGTPAPRSSSAAALLSMSESAAKMALHRLRRRYRDLLRARIAETVSDPSEVDDELRHLLSALS